MYEYEVILDGSEGSEGVVALRPSSSLRTGVPDFSERYGPVTSLEHDLLLLASAIFAADRGTPRGARERLARRISLSVPITNASRIAPHRSQIELILRELSNDSWTLNLPQREGPLEDKNDWPSEDGQVLLFSGGLDSLAGALRISDDGVAPYLVSHVTMNTQTRAAQETLASGLKDLGRDCSHAQFFVSSRSDESQDFDHDIEASQRTRSFLFLVLAALVARRVGRGELIILAENGQMAIHLPLSSARVGAFSTHTAFPDILVFMERFLASVLGRTISISNPFVHDTKAEVIKRLTELCPDLLPLSESCWKNSRLGGGATHCGECVPCFIRRIAIEANGIPDRTAYAREAWDREAPAADDDDVAWRNLVDLAEFIHQFENLSDAEIMDAWPELYSEHVDSGQVINMYRRFSAEAKTVFTSYPIVQRLLK